MKQELYITVKGFKKFCETFDIKITKRDIEKIRKMEKGGINEEKDCNVNNSI